jgi:hypothetical protein
MNYSLDKKQVSFGGQIVITDWRKIKVATPENLQDKVKIKEGVEIEVHKQKEVTPTSTNLAS